VGLTGDSSWNQSLALPKGLAFLVLYRAVMMKMVKDTIVTVLVVGAFLAGAAGMTNQVTQLWPVADTQAELAQASTASTYTIYAKAE
jgi:hypothetical protein